MSNCVVATPRTEILSDHRTADAVQAVAKRRELGTTTPGQLYNAPCVYSLCTAAIKPADGQDLTPDRARERQQHIADALATLREAIAAGWNDFAHIQTDLALAPAPRPAGVLGSASPR